MDKNQVLITGRELSQTLQDALAAREFSLYVNGPTELEYDAVIRICDLENPMNEISDLRADLDWLRSVRKTSHLPPPVLIALCMIAKSEDNATAKFVEATLETERSKRICETSDAKPFKFTCIHVLGASACDTIPDSIASACAHILSGPERRLITKMSLMSANEKPGAWKHAVALQG